MGKKRQTSGRGCYARERKNALPVNNGERLLSYKQSSYANKRFCSPDLVIFMLSTGCAV